jgi:hypothetical protein
MTTCEDKPTIGFRFHFADATTADTNFSSCATTYLTTVCGNFIGLSCSFKFTGGTVNFLNGCGPIYDGPVGFLPFANIGYGVGSPALTSPELVPNMQSCGTSSYSVTYKDTAGAVITKPAFITYNNANHTFSVTTISYADISVTSVIVVNTTNLLTLPGKTATTATYTFTIDVHHPCYDTTINTNTLNSMSIQVNQSTTQLLTFTDTVG